MSIQKPIKFINCFPDDYYYSWQVTTFLHSARKLGYSNQCDILIFKPGDREKWNTCWSEVEKIFPETSFFYYNDDHNIINLIRHYIPILRPYVLWKHFTIHSYLEECSIFYHDCDIILTKEIDFSLFEDDKCYVSDARSYTNSTYFKTKIKDVLPDKKDKYPDILEECAKIVGITKKDIEDNNENSGGAQYILNGVNAPFWSDMISDCMNIYHYLGSVNREFFESEDKGIQRWCTDMFCLLWGLWRRGIKTEVSPELDFAWSTDDISKLEKVKILHNAGITSDSKIRTRYKKEEVECPAFYKGKYAAGGSPYTDTSYVNNILSHEVSKTFCNHYYLSQVMEAAKQYNLVK